jgi:hypothetical protein
MLSHKALFENAVNKTSNWRAYRGTFSLCLQDFESRTSNGIMTTTLNRIGNDTQRNILNTTFEIPAYIGNGPGNSTGYSTSVNATIVGANGQESYWMSQASMYYIATYLESTLRGSASLTSWLRLLVLFRLDHVFGRRYVCYGCPRLRLRPFYWFQ